MNSLVEIPITGSSMSPYLLPGDVLIFDTTQIPKPGNVILFKENNEYVAHRYLPHHKSKGDNNKYFDQWDGQILGVALSRKEKSKKFQVGTGWLNLFLAQLSSRNLQGQVESKPCRLFILFIGTLTRKLGL